ncbi:MAG: ATP-binding cassette domain-containing protein [Myxococcota bacterium]
MSGVALKFAEVEKVYPGASRKALDGVTVEIPSGRQVALVGRSGSGKSTFLHLAAGIDVPTRGSVAIDRPT